MSLLTMIQAASTRFSLNSPTTVTTSSDPQILQLYALARQEGVDLMRRHPWRVLTAEKTFTSTAAAAQVSEFASDFDRFIDESFYNRTKKRPVFGPISAQEWQFTQAMVASTLVESFRVRGADILITPTPNGTDTYAYEYISNKWCQSSTGTAQSNWHSDDDTGILDEEVMTLGIIWRFLRAKGFDYAEAFRTYEIAVADRFAREGGRRRLNFGRRASYGSARMPFIQEGSWSL